MCTSDSKNNIVYKSSIISEAITFVLITWIKYSVMYLFNIIIFNVDKCEKHKNIQDKK